MTNAEIDKKIEGLQKAIDSPATPDAQKKVFQGLIEKLEKQKTEEKPEKKEEKPPKPPKPAREPKTPKPPKTTKPSEKPDEVIRCEKIVAEWRKKREAARNSSRRNAKKPVAEKVADRVESAVTTAIANVPAAVISKNPTAAINKFEKLADAAEKFMLAFKAVLGEDFSQAEINDALKGIDELVKKLKSKYTKK